MPQLKVARISSRINSMDAVSPQQTTIFTAHVRNTPPIAPPASAVRPQEQCPLVGNDAVKSNLGGGQGWIRTTVRSRGQIYSLLPLTTRPPVHTRFSQCQGLRPNLPTPKKVGVRPRKRANAEPNLACQWGHWHRASRKHSERRL